MALWAARLRLATGIAALAVLAVALWFTYSQSSLVALVAIALALAFAAGDRRARLAVAGTAAAFAAAGLVALGVTVASGSAADLTRNRSTLVGDTALVFANHPLVGVGVGGQAVATREEAGTRASLGRSTSHTTPLTIAAELGLLGLSAYLALLAGAASLLLELRRHEPTLALGIGAVLLVLFVHALIYEGFFETAESLGAIALACAALRARAMHGRAPRPLAGEAGALRSAREALGRA
jgi:O-antigen ligase